MEFSEKFKSKYLEPEVDESMKEVIEKVSPYLDAPGFWAFQKDKEIILETVYAFKHTIAEEANIDMEKIYPKIGKLAYILDDEISRSKAAGIILTSEDEGDGRIFYINISTEHNLDTDTRRMVLMHELCHLLSEETVVEDGKVIPVECGLKHRMMDEVVTEGCTMKMLGFLGYETKDKTYTLTDTSNNLFSNIYMTNDAYGYGRMSGYAEIMEKVYTPKFLYKDKFTNDMNIENIFGKKHLDSVERLLKTINGTTGNMVDIHLALQSIYNEQIVDASGLFSPEVSEYIKYCQALNNFNITSDKPSATVRLLNSIWGNDEAISIPCNITSYMQQEIEIRNFYDCNGDVFKELNPNTRSQDCYDFLIAMEALKGLDVQYSEKELENLKYERVDFEGSSVLKLIVGEDTYLIASDINEQTGIISLKSVISNESSEEEKKHFRNCCFSLSNVSAEEVSVSFDKMADIERFSNVYSTIFVEAYFDGGFGDETISFKEALECAAVMKNMDPNVIKNLVNVCDISTIKDLYGNNFFHILACNDCEHAANILREIYMKNPEETVRLLNTENDKGVTPLDLVHSRGNFSLIYGTYQLGIRDESAEIIRGLHLNEKNGRYVEVDTFIINTGDSGFINHCIQNGLSSFATDSEKNTLLHLYAMGKLPDLDIVAIMNADADIDAVNGKNLTPLQVAIEKLDTEKVLTLLKFDASPDFLEDALLAKRNLETMGASLFDLKKSDIIINNLIDAGANVNAISDTGMTPLQVAAGVGLDEKDRHVNIETVRTLIEAGANPFQRTDDYPSFRDFAAETGDFKSLELLIKLGVDKELIDIPNTNLTSQEKAQLENMPYTVNEELSNKIRESIKEEAAASENSEENAKSKSSDTVFDAE